MWRQICHLEKFLRIRNVETICFVLIYAVLSQNQFVLPFTLFCRKINFVAIYAFLRGEKFRQKLCLWRKKDKYQVWYFVPSQSVIHYWRGVKWHISKNVTEKRVILQFFLNFIHESGVQRKRCDKLCKLTLDLNAEKLFITRHPILFYVCVSFLFFVATLSEFLMLQPLYHFGFKLLFANLC